MYESGCGLGIAAAVERFVGSFFLADEGNPAGSTLRAVAQPIDDSSTGQLMEGILAAFSEFDNNMRRQRTVTDM